MSYVDAVTASHWWTAERKDRSMDQRALRLLILLFETLEALHATTRQIPDEWTQPEPGTSLIGSAHNIHLSTPIPTDKLIILRASITLVGDVFVISRALSRMDILELAEPVENLLSASEVFRDLRNFYTHLDERYYPH